MAPMAARGRVGRVGRGGEVDGQAAAEEIAPEASEAGGEEAAEGGEGGGSGGAPEEAWSLHGHYSIPCFVRGERSAFSAENTTFLAVETVAVRGELSFASDGCHRFADLT